MEPQEAAKVNDIKTWLACYKAEPVSCTREDQKKAFKWFDDQWKDKWPLHRAAMYGDIAAIRTLIVDKGMDPNQKMTDWYDSEPLGWSASLGHLAATIKLIQLGADPMRPKNKAGYTPLTDAQREGHQPLIKFLEAYELRSSIVDPDTLRGIIATVNNLKVVHSSMKGHIEFSDDGSFYNHVSEMSGEWHIDVGSAADDDGPKLILYYQDNKVEAVFAVTKIHRGGLFDGGIELNCVRSTGHFFTNMKLKPMSMQPEVQLTLKSHPGKGLNLHHHTDSYGGHDVLWAALCDASSAMTVLLDQHDNGLFIRLSDRDGHSFDCAAGKYHDGNEVPIYHNHKGQNQWFLVNPDGTVSPTCAANMAWGYDTSRESHKQLILVKRGDKRQLVFDSLPVTKVAGRRISPKLLSHPGKAICLNGSNRQHDHGMEQFLKFGSEAQGVTLELQDGFVHIASSLYQTFDAYTHNKRSIEFFTKHADYGHQRFVVNRDGKLGLESDPSMVVGCNSAQTEIWMVKTTDKNAFVFADLIPEGETATPM